MRNRLMKYRIDALSLRDGTLVIEGWAMGEDKNPVAVTMTDRKGEPIRYTAVQRDRADVFQQFGADRMCGFTAAAPWDRDSDGYLVLSDGKTTRRVRVNEGKVKSKTVSVPNGRRNCWRSFILKRWWSAGISCGKTGSVPCGKRPFIR